MKRGLKNRHLQMIALGGAIGTGLFYGSASTIELAGPSVMFAYFIGGAIIYFIMRMLGEMAVDEPVSGSFSHYAKKYWGAFPGFLSGWNYWFNYVIVSMAELTAVGIYMNFWLPNLPQWLSALAVLVIITALNLINVRAYGESEFWMALVKITAIIAMIVFGLYLIFTSPFQKTSATFGKTVVFSRTDGMGWHFPSPSSCSPSAASNSSASRRAKQRIRKKVFRVPSIKFYGASSSFTSARCLY